jgi:integrase
MKIGLYKERTCKGVQWRCRWFGKYDPNTGAQKRYGRTFALRKDAERFLKTKDAEFGRGTPRDLSNERLKDYAERWLSNKIQIQDIRPATVELYRLTLNRLYAHFGEDCLLWTIDRQSALSFIAALQPLRPAKSNLSGWSRHRVLRHCKTLFKDAVENGVIPNNPFKTVKGPKCVTSDWYYLKPDEYFRLLDATPSLQEKVLYALCFTGGLRETEAISLAWSDIDFAKARLRVVNRPESQTLPPFNIKDSDARTIPLPKQTLDLLTQLHAEAPEGTYYLLLTKEREQKVCEKWDYCRESGRPWLTRYWANNLTRNFHRRVRQAGIETLGKNLTVHTLRKCCLQNWQNYVPMNVVKVLAGHSSITTTEKFYSTIDESHLDNAAKVTDELLNSAANAETDRRNSAEPDMTDRKMTFSPVQEAIQDVG